MIGRGKTFAYVALVAVFSIAAGLLYGAWVDGVGLGVIALGGAGFATVLAITLAALNGRRSKSERLQGERA